MERNRYDLATIDLDGTLVSGTAFAAIAKGAGFGEEIARIDADYYAGKISLEQCFWKEYPLFVGLRKRDVDRYLDGAPWIGGIEEAVAMIKDAGIGVAVLTDQPRFVCDYLAKFGLDEAICSETRLDGDRVPKTIDARFDKLANLQAFARNRTLDLAHVAHHGNGTNDARVFAAVGLGIAINPEEESVADSADLSFNHVTDLRPVVESVLDVIWNDEKEEPT